MALMTAITLMMLIPGGHGAMALNSGGTVPGDASSITVKLVVYSSLGVSLDGKESSNAKAIRIGDPATGTVSYVVLDG